MCVHVYVVTSYPSCTSFTLRRMAIDRKVRAAKKAVEIVLNTFNVGDCLRPVSLDKHAVVPINNIMPQWRI